MRTRSLLIGSLLFCLLASSGSVAAHHSWSGYDMSNLITVKGTVVNWLWANPHCIVMFDAKDDHGNLVHWAGEAGSPAALGLLGWSKSSVQPGDVIAVYMYPAKSGNPVGRLNKIVFPDGTSELSSYALAD
jgi:hypothetical protein